MNTKNNDQGQASENRYARIEAALKKAVFPQTVEIESEGFAPEQFQTIGLHRVELFAAVAMASMAHAAITSTPTAGGTLRTDWKRRVAVEAVAMASLLDEALDEIRQDLEPAKGKE